MNETWLRAVNRGLITSTALLHDYALFYDDFSARCI